MVIICLYITLISYEVFFKIEHVILKIQALSFKVIFNIVNLFDNLIVLYFQAFTKQKNKTNVNINFQHSKKVSSDFEVTFLFCNYLTTIRIFAIFKEYRHKDDFFKNLYFIISILHFENSSQNVSLVQKLTFKNNLVLILKYTEFTLQ